MAEQSLESRVIAGAARAVATDPSGIVAKAKDKAAATVVTGMAGIAAAFQRKKKERELEEEKIKTKRDALIKGYDDQFNNIKKQRINDGGLGMNAWNEATNLAEGMKVEYDACTVGKEGDRCRQEMRMKLTNMSKLWTGANEVMDTIVTTDENKDIKSSAYNEESETGRSNSHIRANCSDENMTSRLKNEEEIAEVEDHLSRGDYEFNPNIGTKEQLEAYLEELKDPKNNVLQIGWSIPSMYEPDNPEYNTFISQDDDRLKNLQANVVHEVGNNYVKNLTEVSKPKWEAYKSGEKDGEAFNKSKSINLYKNTILDEDNITSVYYDTLITDEPLREHLKLHPDVLFAEMEYKDIVNHSSFYGRNKEEKEELQKRLLEYDTDGDGIVDEGEMDMTDLYLASDQTGEGGNAYRFRDDLIDALSDPEHENYNYKTSEKLAAEWLADNEQMEYNKDMYGDDFNTLSRVEQSERIKRLTDPGYVDVDGTPLYADKAEFVEAGGNLGALRGKNQTWDDITQSWVSRKVEGGADSLES